MSRSWVLLLRTSWLSPPLAMVLHTVPLRMPPGGTSSSELMARRVFCMGIIQLPSLAWSMPPIIPL